MEPGKDASCPNCAELWKRLDKLTEEKALAEKSLQQKTQRVQLAASITLFVLILAGLIVRLLAG